MNKMVKDNLDVINKVNDKTEKYTNEQKVAAVEAYKIGKRIIKKLERIAKNNSNLKHS